MYLLSKKEVRMISKYAFLCLFIILGSFVQCSPKSDKDIKTSDVIENSIEPGNNNPQPANQDQEKTTGKAAPGDSESSDNSTTNQKLTNILERIEKLDERLGKVEESISSLTHRVDNLETHKGIKSAIKTKTKTTKKPRRKRRFTRAKKLNREIVTLKKKLRRKIVQQQRLIRSLSKRKNWRVSSSRRGNYRIYLGSFRHYNNAVKRRRYVSRLGIPTTLKKKGWAKSYFIIDDRKAQAPTRTDGDIYVEERDPGYYNKRNNVNYNNILYQVVSSRSYNYRKAVQLCNFLLSRGYDAFIKKIS